MTKAEKSRIFWNSVLVIVACVSPLFLTLTASAITGNLAAGVPLLALWVILPFVALLRKQLSKLPNNGVKRRSFDRPLAYCIIAGAFIAFPLTFVAGINSTTQLPDPGDTVTPVTSTYSVFGVAVVESTGPWGTDISRRLTQFESLVSLVFVTVGMITGLVVYLIGFRKRGRAESELEAFETAGE